MSKKEKQHFNKMLITLRRISKGYMTPNQLLRNSKKQYGLDYVDALELSYENIKSDASNCIKNIREIKKTNEDGG